MQPKKIKAPSQKNQLGLGMVFFNLVQRWDSTASEEQMPQNCAPALPLTCSPATGVCPLPGQTCPSCGCFLPGFCAWVCMAASSDGACQGSCPAPADKIMDCQITGEREIHDKSSSWELQRRRINSPSPPDSGIFLSHAAARMLLLCLTSDN